MQVGRAAVVLGVVLSACGSPSPTITDQASMVPTVPPEASCEGISLRAPDGTVVLLTGRWIGSGDPNALPAPSIFDITQVNDCVAWVGRSAEPDEPLGESWIETFSGHAFQDYTVSGGWFNVVGPGFGSVTLQIEFVDTPDGSTIELHQIASSGNIHRIKLLVREEAAP